MAARDYRINRKGTGELLLGNEIRGLVTDRAEMAMAIYREKTKRRTGRNAREVRVSTERGGKKNDRWVGVVTAYSPYAVAREFGNKRTKNPDRGLAQAAAELDGQ